MLAADLPPRLKDDATLLIDTVREAGALALSQYRKDVRKWAKPDGSTVTNVDLEVDALLKLRLQTARPSYGWLSEETADTPARLSHSKIWIADPIDGTSSYANGTDEWCVGVALVEGQRPVLSALFRPVTGDLYWAAAGYGAFCNDAAITPNDGAALQGANLLGTGRALKSLPGVEAHSTPNIPLLLRLAFVASGKADIALSIGLRNDWDLAAGDLLVHEAGGRLSQADGSDMQYNLPMAKQNGLVAAGLLRHRAVIKQLETL